MQLKPALKLFKKKVGGDFEILFRPVLGWFTWHMVRKLFCNTWNPTTIEWEKKTSKCKVFPKLFLDLFSSPAFRSFCICSSAGEPPHGVGPCCPFRRRCRAEWFGDSIQAIKEWKRRWITYRQKLFSFVFDFFLAIKTNPYIHTIYIFVLNSCVIFSFCAVLLAAGDVRGCPKQYCNMYWFCHGTCIPLWTQAVFMWKNGGVIQWYMFQMFYVYFDTFSLLADFQYFFVEVTAKLMEFFQSVTKHHADMHPTCNCQSLQEALLEAPAAPAPTAASRAVVNPWVWAAQIRVVVW